MLLSCSSTLSAFPRDPLHSAPLHSNEITSGGVPDQLPTPQNVNFRRESEKLAPDKEALGVVEKLLKVSWL